MEDIIKGLSGLGSAAVDAFKGISGVSAQQTAADAAKKQAAAQLTTAQTVQKYAPWVIGGGLLLVLGFVIIRRSR